MQIKFFNIETLDTNIINIKHGTMEDVLDKAEETLPNFNKTILSEKGDTLKFTGYIGDVLYRGKTRKEFSRGKAPRDWSEELEAFKKFYKPTLTAKALSALSGLSLCHVYYLSRKHNFELTPGQRGKRK